MALSAYAAPAPVAPPVTPGAIGDTLKQPTELQPPSPAPDISAPQRPQAQGSEQGPRITVSNFVFTGNTVFGDAVLQPLVAPYLNKPITLGQLYEAADAVAEFYARKGYTLANVAVPAQKVTGGTVTLEVIEGRVGRIEFEGNHHYGNGALHAYVSHTRPGQVYQAAPLQDDLEVLNSLPGLAARAVLKPGRLRHQRRGHQDQGRFDRWQRGVVDNYGRKDTGELRTSASLTVNNPIGIGDQINLLGTHSAPTSSTTGTSTTTCRSTPPACVSTAITATPASSLDAFLGGGAAQLDGKDASGQGNISQTWWRTSSSSFTSSAGFLHTDANATIGGPSAEDTNVNLLNLGATWSRVWRNASATQITGSFHGNFRQAKRSALAPGDLPRDLGHERLRLEIDAQHLEPLPERLQLLVNLDAEQSPDPLADTEKLSMGGPDLIRGFPPSECAATAAGSRSPPLRRAFPIGPLTVLPRVYGDAGRAINVDPAGQGDTGETLASAGVGADAIYRTITLKVDWAYPFDGKPVSDGRNNGRVYAALSAGF